MNIKGTLKTWLLVTAGLILLFILMMFSITSGVADIPYADVFRSVVNFDSSNVQHLIVLDVRLPRVIAGALAGAGLSVAGAVMQGTTRNPLADSGLLGLNAGAGFALSICFAFFPSMEYMQIIFFSFAGAGIGALLVNTIAGFRRSTANPMRLVLAGAAVTAFLTALSQGVALYFNVAQDILFWTAGGFTGASWAQVKVMTPWILSSLAVSMLLGRCVSVLSLGEAVAKGLGVNIPLNSLLTSLTVVILAGASVAVAGSVSFVGLIFPHIARFLVGGDYRYIIPVSAVLGALMMVLADLCARSINPPAEVPVGAIAALVGVPFFLYLARRQRRAS